MDRDKIIKELKQNVSKKRYEHSVGVEYTSVLLAYRFGVDPEKARLAGLLHDCAKGLSGKEKIEKAKKAGFTVSKYDEKNPEMLHARLGAFLAKSKYGVKDKDVLSAIALHTTGKAAMSDLEKIIFVADFIEPNRKELKCMAKIRSVSFENLDKAVYLVLKHTLEYLEENGSEIDDASLDTYEYYKQFA